MRPTLVLTATVLAILNPVMSQWVVSFYADPHCAPSMEFDTLSGYATPTGPASVRSKSLTDSNAQCLHFDTAFPANCKYFLTMVSAHGRTRQPFLGPVDAEKKKESHEFNQFSYSCT
ncbi:hypothetical protein BDP27DRAFT_1418876 [Rhodocollybia butyracea]|uniref:Uncharacterized protein n=1 Tax=Rhodocollybia butyracea TaxID=206335 RepID=A0A9P5PYE1_9AGAR|nr:hypothetical protein BDP27DRAFT_1418876 [Rhodocollybia butyracea]